MGEMTPWLQDPDVTLYHGDCLDVLRSLPDRSVHMCATSPPFYGLRDYGTGEWEGGNADCDHLGKPHSTQAGFNERYFGKPSGTDKQGDLREPFKGECGKCGARRVDRQIGLEETPDQWVTSLVNVFREVRRVLRDDGTLWVEIGDSYNGTGGNNQGRGSTSLNEGRSDFPVRESLHDTSGVRTSACKSKDLLGQPWLLAFALRADGWYLRSEIIWARPNPMPESVTDRPTKSHSTIFLLSKQPRYFYDADAIRTALSPDSLQRGYTASKFGNGLGVKAQANPDRNNDGEPWTIPSGANARSVWTIPTQPTPFAHFATWPQKLVARMIQAGTSERGRCPECGKPWVRDVDTTYERPATGGGKQPTHNPQRGAMPLRVSKVVETLGWSPSCLKSRCKTGRPPVPCTVLDPFAGSGTTLLVARQHGRHSIGIELNADYCAIAAERLQQLSLLA